MPACLLVIALIQFYLKMEGFRVRVLAFSGIVAFTYIYLNLMNAHVSINARNHGHRSVIEKKIRQLKHYDTVVKIDQIGERLNRTYTTILTKYSESSSTQSHNHHTENVTSQIGIFPKIVSSSGDEVGCYFLDRLEKDGLPIIHSAFIDIRDQQVVMVGVRRKNMSEFWENESFLCDFDNTSDHRTLLRKSNLITVSDPILPDFQKVGHEEQGVVIITCPVPIILQNHSALVFNLRRKSDPQRMYKDITVCRNASPKRKHLKLAMCTMMKNMDRFVPDWLEYHKNLGVERVYIYNNAKSDKLVHHLKAYLASGFVTVIPWTHTISVGKTYLETQIASENDCIWRHRYEVEWMIKIDVDEFLQPMDPTRPKITDYFEDWYSTLGSIKLQNWFFCPPPRGDPKRQIARRAKTIFERNMYRTLEPTELNRGRDKTIVHPVNVHYFKIHIVKWGSPAISLSPISEIRMVHYRGDNPLHIGFCPHKLVRDTSMFDLWRSFSRKDMRKS